MRKIYIAGNWKMNKDASSTDEFCQGLRENLQSHQEERVVPLIAPVYPFLAQAKSFLVGSPACVAAQDVSAHAEGAYTGEVSAQQLSSLSLSHCIIGHSERRQYHQESDALIREKLLQLQLNGIIPILCVGETLPQREAGQTGKVVLEQLSGCLDQVEIRSGAELLIAYEPVWAIGTGRTATAEQAQEVHALIRSWLEGTFGKTIAESAHILYGGSVKPDNIEELLTQADVDGGLIGGASLNLKDFCRMIDIAVELIATGRK
jgi:triosephosphate isomerase